MISGIDAQRRENHLKFFNGKVRRILVEQESLLLLKCILI
jgi:hypothetical protein